MHHVSPASFKSAASTLSPRDGAPPAPNSASDWVERGSAAYHRVSLALFLAGFATFSLLYCVQPLLPLLARDFQVSPAQSSLALSLSTSLLALAIFCAAAVSEGFGRRGLMFGSLVAASALNIVVAGMPDWHFLLLARALEGLALGGVPAVAMAYLSEEIDPRGLGSAMGLYVAGTAFGGMSGRMMTGILAETFGWRPALAILGALCLLAAVGFALLLPPSRHFIPQREFHLDYHRRAWSSHLRDGAMVLLFAIGFLVMGSYVTVYNYIGFRLTAPPYGLNQTQLGLIFAIPLVGVAASSIAGFLADRVGRAAVLPVGVLLMIAGLVATRGEGLGAIVAGVILVTSGFFCAHAVASGWVGRLARTAKGHASSLYLLTYYLGSSLVGSSGGWFWARGGWGAVVGFVMILLLLGLLAAWGLRRIARRRQAAPLGS
jgi:MFS transporter, YNFM family, putative membrane transport protein